MTNKRLR